MSSHRINESFFAQADSGRCQISHPTFFMTLPPMMQSQPAAEHRDSNLVSALCFKMTFWLVFLQILGTMLMCSCNGLLAEYGLWPLQGVYLLVSWMPTEQGCHRQTGRTSTSPPNTRWTGVVFCVGNPQVFLAVPIPVWQVRVFVMGQFIVPIPVVGNLWVCTNNGK